MHYYVDGYNLLFRVIFDDIDLKTQRQQIIQELNSKITIANIDVSIVFDAHFVAGESIISHYKHLEILYTAQGETADDFILNRLRTECSHPQQEVVVTSDKRLAWRARRLSAHTQTIEEFLSWLNKVYRNKLRQPPVTNVAQPIKTTPKKPAEGSAEYYLHAFETRYEILTESEKKRKLEDKRRKTKQ